MLRGNHLARLLLTAVAVALFAPAAAAKDDDLKTYWGRPAALGNGTATTYVTVTKHKTPVSLGVAFPASALAGLPEDDAHMRLILDFPAQARLTPFQYMMLNWNPHGHPPPGVYDPPHFDFHFYMQDLAEVEAIDPGPCSGLDCEDYNRAVAPVPPQYVPQDYQNVGAVEPQMGNHLIDFTAPEWNGQPFTKTWLYGTYDGRITFYEPMITRAYLERRPDETVALKLPQAYAQSGFYPTKYRVRYDARSGLYTVSLEEFVYRAAS